MLINVNVVIVAVYVNQARVAYQTSVLSACLLDV